MPEGYKIKDWKSLPVAERAALFGERLLKFGLENLTSPDDVDRFDRMNHLTVGIYTGKLSPEERKIAQAEIDELRGMMLNNPDRNVGRAIFDYGWMDCCYLFFARIKNWYPNLSTRS